MGEPIPAGVVVDWLGAPALPLRNLHAVLARAGVHNPTVLLDLWWLRRKDGAERDTVSPTTPRDELTTRMRARAKAWMGEAQFATYEQDPDARWIVIPARPTRAVAPRTGQTLRVKTP